MQTAPFGHFWSQGRGSLEGGSQNGRRALQLAGYVFLPALSFSPSSPVRWGQHNLPHTGPVTVRNKIRKYTLSTLNRESCYHSRGDRHKTKLRNLPHGAHGSPTIQEAFAWAIKACTKGWKGLSLLSCPQTQPESISSSWVTRMGLGQGEAGGWAWGARGNKTFLLKLHTPLGPCVGGRGTHTVYPHTEPSPGPAHSSAHLMRVTEGQDTPSFPMTS